MGPHVTTVIRGQPGLKAEPIRPFLSPFTNFATGPFVFHFTPTSCSWLNAVETFFAALTRRRLRRGVFYSIVDLQAAINRYIAVHNTEPKPFVWTADPECVLAAINRGKQALEAVRLRREQEIRVVLTASEWSTRLAC